MNNTLEKLTEGGWDKVGDFVDYEIYRKEYQRILYDPKTDEIFLKYNFDDTSSKQSASEIEE